MFDNRKRKLSNGLYWKEIHHQMNITHTLTINGHRGRVLLYMYKKAHIWYLTVHSIREYVIVLRDIVRLVRITQLSLYHTMYSVCADF